MNSFESQILSWLLNSLWQVPLIFATAWVAAWLVRPVGPRMEHRVWVGAIVCEVLVPFVSLLPLDGVRFRFPWDAHSAVFSDGSVSILMSGGTPSPAMHLPPAVFSIATGAYVVIACYFALRFAWQCIRVSRLSLLCRPLPPSPDVMRSCEKWASHFGLRDVVIATSEALFAPVTVGFWRKRVLLPEGLDTRLSRDDLDIAIAHEFAHVRRNDFAKNLLYEIITIPITYHPVLWFTRQHLAESREMVCDEMAAGVSGSRLYAQSLLRLASLLLQGRSVRIPHAIGIFDANTFERRLMRITEKRTNVSRARRYSSLAACIALGLITTGSALALRLAVDSPAAPSKQESKNAVPKEIPPGEMQKRIITKVNPTYPPEAKKARIQGVVILHAVIGKTGNVENLKALSGPVELQQSALDAVRQWKYRPVLLKGHPVEVETKITVNYTLSK